MDMAIYGIFSLQFQQSAYSDEPKIYQNTPSKASLKRGTHFDISLSFSWLGIIGRYGLIGCLLVT